MKYMQSLSRHAWRRIVVQREETRIQASYRPQEPREATATPPYRSHDLSSLSALQHTQTTPMRVLIEIWSGRDKNYYSR